MLMSPPVAKDPPAAAIASGLPHLQRTLRETPAEAALSVLISTIAINDCLLVKMTGQLC
jgi:hypothetical protein